MWIVLSLCAAYFAFCVGTNPAGPLTTPDSLHYLNVSPMYPLGYPLFLRITGPNGAIIAQPLVFCATLAWLGSETVRLTRSTWLAAAIVAGAMLLPQIREFHASILSESLFLSLLIAFLAMGVRFAYHPSWRLMVFAAVAAGVSASVRRTGYALVPVMLFMVLAQRDRLRGSRAALFGVAVLAPFLVIVGPEQVASVVHAGHPSSLMRRHMFAKAALIGAPSAPPSDDSVRLALDHQLQFDYAPIRALLASAPPDLRAVLSLYYETCLQYGCVDRSRELMAGVNEADQTRTLGAAGLARIRLAPLAFVQLMAMNYQALWTIDRLHHPDRATRLSAFIAAHRPLPFERQAFSLESDQVLEFRPTPRVRYVQVAMNVVQLWTAVFVLAGLIGLATRRHLRHCWPSPSPRHWPRTAPCCSQRRWPPASRDSRWESGRRSSPPRCLACGRYYRRALLRVDVGAAFPQHEFLNLPSRRFRQLADRCELVRNLEVRHVVAAEAP